MEQTKDENLSTGKELCKSKELVTRYELCEYLKVCEVTIYEWEQRGHLKAYRKGNRVWYYKYEMNVITKNGFETIKNKDLITQEELSKKLKVMYQTLINWGKEGKLKPYKMGGRVYYCKNEIKTTEGKIEMIIDKELITRKELCEMLKVTYADTLKWEREGKIKSYRIGRRAYYCRNEILANMPQKDDV